MTLLRPFTRESSALRSRQGLFIDVIVLVGVIVTLYVLVQLSNGVTSPYSTDRSTATVSTDPAELPYYAARSLLRMFAALAASVIFTLIFATVAARSRRAGLIMIPILDILQSVPVLGFLSVTLTVWLTLFPGSSLGVECAAVFAIFTSQAWNMTFAFYQSLVTQPRELDEAARILRLTKWQRFWKLDVPGAMIPLVWNGMMSFGGGWFFLVASEVISVNNHTYALPGIGSFVASAAAEGDVPKIVLAIVTMVAMVVGVNFFFWRPLTAWAERFRNEDSEGSEQQKSYVFELLRHSRLPRLLGRLLRPVGAASMTLTRPFGRTDRLRPVSAQKKRAGDLVFGALLTVAIAFGAVQLVSFLGSQLAPSELFVVAGDGLITFARVVAVVVVASLVWVPIGVWIGMNPRVSRIAQPIVQVLASFPANFLFPIVAILLIATHVSLDFGGIFLMSLGAQWYLLFNVIAGASAIPNDLREASTSLGLSRVLRWKRLIGPAIFSAFVTGGITAAGGAWNASIVSEIISYNGTTLQATGLGAYIADATANGDFARTLLGITVMSIFVVGLNRLFWRRLYTLAENRFAV